MTVSEEKVNLRKKAKLLESALSSDYIKNSSIAICSQLVNMEEYKTAETVFCFVSLNTEPDTYYFLNDVLNSGKRLCVPLCVSKGYMQLREIRSINELSPGAYGIPEPSRNSPVIYPDSVDFAVIPCLCCDRFGNRLGKGGGFYDRFLKNYSNSAVMLCFSKLLQNHIPTDIHDCVVNHVLTEEGLYINGISK